MVLLESQIKLKTGDIAPDFHLLGVDDKKHTLNDCTSYQGILVIFICNHCPYVKAKAEAFNELYEKFGDKIAIIGINSNDSKDYPEDSFENMKKTANPKIAIINNNIKEFNVKSPKPPISFTLTEEPVKMLIPEIVLSPSFITSILLIFCSLTNLLSALI